jgi:hypothetical protein
MSFKLTINYTLKWGIHGVMMWFGKEIGVNFQNHSLIKRRLSWTSTSNKKMVYSSCNGGIFISILMTSPFAKLTLTFTTHHSSLILIRENQIILNWLLVSKEHITFSFVNNFKENIKEAILIFHYLIRVWSSWWEIKKDNLPMFPQKIQRILKFAVKISI